MRIGYALSWSAPPALNNGCQELFDSRKLEGYCDQPEMPRMLNCAWSLHVSHGATEGVLVTAVYSVRANRNLNR